MITQQDKNATLNVLAATLGDCIHTVSLMKFLSMVEDLGYQVNFMGTAQTPEAVARKIGSDKPDVIVLSYRLTPSNARTLFSRLKKSLDECAHKDYVLILGGTKPVLSEASTFDLFDRTFSEVYDKCPAIQILRREHRMEGLDVHHDDLISRIESVYPMPLIRHHFGLPTMEDTVRGVRQISESEMVDIISIGPDQNAQEFFFAQDRMDPSSNGAGGVPIRNKNDLSDIYKASRCGNYPLIRCYAGTTNLIRWADMLDETIHIAWGAVPISWYSELDGRSSRPLENAIRENQQAITHYARKNIPVEINESHQWALRNTSDVIEVAAAYIAAHNAKKLGVRHNIMQYMTNTPADISPEMDMAKMLAKVELVEELHDDSFTSYRMVRTGLTSLSSDPDIAKGQLASAITLSMALKPHIVHVVAFSEGDHLAEADDVIESCKIARGVINNCLKGLPNFTDNEDILRRKGHIIREVNVLLEAIRDLSPYSRDPLSDPDVLTKAIKIGLLDAPLLKGNSAAKGEIVTKIINGACQAIDRSSGEVIDEEYRIKQILN